MELDLRKSDIHRFGHTTFPDDGNLSIVFDGDLVYGISIILLRNILKVFGLNYRIVEEVDWWSDENADWPDEICVRTNLPWDVFISAEQE